MLRRRLGAVLAAGILLAFTPTALCRAEDVAWHPPIYPAAAAPVALADQGVPPDAGSDSAAAINAVLAKLKPGQTLLLSPGTYRIGSPLLIPSGVSLQGPQAADGTPLATLKQTAHFSRWQKLDRGLLMNLHYNSAAIEDRDITITAVAFDDDSTGVLMRMAENVVVQGARFIGGGDGTAFLASQHTRVSHCLALRTINAAFDQWDGDEDATVEDSIARASAGYGILFNGVDTDETSRTARDFTALGNDLAGVGKDELGIWVAPLGKKGGSHIAGRITIFNNTIHDPQGGVNAGGISIETDDANLVAVQGNHVSGSRGYLALSVGGWGPPKPGERRGPQQLLVIDNSFEGNRVHPHTPAVVSVSGDSIVLAHNRFSANATENGAAVPLFASPYHKALNAFDNSAGTGVLANAASQGSGNLQFATPCPDGKTCAYEENRIDFKPLAMSCQSDKLQVRQAWWGVNQRRRDCTTYVARECNDTHACLIVFEPQSCGADPAPGVVKNATVQASCTAP